MTKGILLFAFNGGYDYVSLAIVCAKRIKNYIQLPISIVTDSKEYLIEHYPNDLDLFDNIIESNDSTEQQKRFYNGTRNCETFNWKNSNRVLSYDLSPYDHTLVLDTDYIINSDFLEKCFEIDTDFLIFKDFCDLAQWRDTKDFQYVSDFSIPFYWATVFIFKKTEKNLVFFELLKFIFNNWEYYRLLYQIKESTFRNDYAFSIAIHIFSDGIPNAFTNLLPGNMYYVLDRDFLIKSENNSLWFLLEKKDFPGEYTPMKISNLDVHVMNKFSIMETFK